MISNTTNTAQATSAPSGISTAKADKKEHDSKDIKQAAAQFEAILVRQMLQSASVAGKGNYADMGVEALSTAVTSGGGIGLGRAIEHAVEQAHHAGKTADPEAMKKKPLRP